MSEQNQAALEAVAERIANGCDHCGPTTIKAAVRKYLDGWTPPAATEWISVKDRLPRKGCGCLVARTGGGIVLTRRCRDKQYPWDTATHWQPLPDPPRLKWRKSERRDEGASHTGRREWDAMCNCHNCMGRRRLDSDRRKPQEPTA